MQDEDDYDEQPSDCLYDVPETTLMLILGAFSAARQVIVFANDTQKYSEMLDLQPKIMERLSIEAKNQSKS